jgi:hypothetical protein
MIGNSQGASVIMPRRNFLIRALGFTAGGATMALPIVTVADAKARVDYHAKELEAAFRDYYSGLTFSIGRQDCSPEQIRERGGHTIMHFVAQQMGAGT